MSRITSLYVYKVVEQAGEGVETRDLLEELRLAPDGPIDPTKSISSQQYYRFFAALAARDPEGAKLPLRIGAAMRIDDFGAFGLAWKSAPNLRGSFVRSERYGRVLGNAETYSIEKSPEGAYFSLEKDGDGSLGMLLSNETSICAVATLCREVSAGPFSPQGMFFKHSARDDPSVYAAHFGCPVHFASDRDALLLSEESLEVPNKVGDATIAAFFDRYLEGELAKLTPRTSLERQVRQSVSQMLSEGVPTISSIASTLAMSARTLQRRLSDEGYTFQNLVDQARRDLAKQLLRETDYSLAEIAFLTGFAEQSGFTRAFKRWSGQTPRSYRIDGECQS